MRKASANMWWIIIGAVIALVVMIILMVMFTSKSGRLEGGLLDCESKGGSCLTEDGCESIQGTISRAFECNQGPAVICCFSSNRDANAQ